MFCLYVCLFILCMLGIPKFQRRYKIPWMELLLQRVVNGCVGAGR